MEIIIIDDELAALSTFLYNIVDEKDIKYKMFLSSAPDAIEYVKNNNVAAAFLDINMPAINGVELAEKLIKAKADIKIIFTTGYAYNEQDIRDKIGENLLAFCNKPYNKELLINILGQVSQFVLCKRNVSIRTFGCFDIFVNKKPVKFSCAKSKELIALLVEKNGAYLSMSEAIMYLWPDKNVEHAKRLYRDAVYRLRMTLRENNLLGLATVERARLVINTANIDCDYWRFLKGEDLSYNGSYLPNFDWSIDTQSRLDVMLGKE